MLGNQRDAVLITGIFVFIGGLVFMAQGGFGVWWENALFNLGNAVINGLLWADLRRSGAQILTRLFAGMTLLALSIALYNLALALS
jgi:hypothetical protein